MRKRLFLFSIEIPSWALVFLLYVLNECGSVCVDTTIHLSFNLDFTYVRFRGNLGCKFKTDRREKDTKFFQGGP